MGKGTVRLEMADGRELEWKDSYLIHEGARHGDDQCRVIVHAGNWVRASYRSDQVLSAVLVEDFPS